MTTITYIAIARQAQAAANFIVERREAGLHVATDDQLRRAKRMVDGNPTLRNHRGPLELQLLALKMPMTRRDRKAAKLELQPRRTRTNDRAEVEADPQTVAKFVEENPEMTQLEAAQAIAGMHGYADLTPVIRRVERFTRSETETRIPNHLREKMVCLSAIAQAATLIAERDEARAKAAAEAEGQADA